MKVSTELSEKKPQGKNIQEPFSQLSLSGWSFGI